MSEVYSVYFAGDLFNHKDLIGNMLLADAIETESDGRFQCVVPQHLEQSTGRSVDIRNKDLLEVAKADLIFLNFDGTELDSGSVIEFLFAKALDVPAVILRSDFRMGGDQYIGGNPWNLMVSGYPRTRIVTCNSMQFYQEAWKQGGGKSAVIERLYGRYCQSLLPEFDAVLKESPILNDETLSQSIYEWVMRFPGDGLQDMFSPQQIKSLLQEKRKKGLLVG